VKRRMAILAVVVVASIIAQGKSTKLIASVKNPGYSGAPLHRILIIGMSQDPAIRSDFEDAMAQKLTTDHIEAIPGHSILLRPESAELDMKYLKAQIAEHKIDGVVISHLMHIDKNVTYIPGYAYTVPYPYYRSFYGYYGNVYHQVYSPDYLRTDTTVRIETNVYATRTPEGEFIWTGISDTFNPKSAPKVIEGVVKLVAQELEKEGVFQ
jgi:hypothetical protein